MTRPRTIFFLAWGLLAVGSAIQFVESTRGEAGQVDHSSEAATGAVTGSTDGDQAGRADGPTGSGAGQAHQPPDRLADRNDARPPTGEPGPSEPVDRAGESRPAIGGAATRGSRPSARPALVATVVGDGVASEPELGGAAPTHWFPNPTQFGGERTFLVVDSTTSDEYVKVSLPVMPNGQDGWIPRSAVELSAVSHRAEVDLSSATVTVWRGEVEVLTTKAVTGKASTPTPIGRFYIRDIIAQRSPGGAYGPWILALSGFSESMDTFGGGLPALALHGTDRPDQVGSAISSGCVRVPNSVITALAETVPIGTPVTIVA